MPGIENIEFDPPRLELVFQPSPTNEVRARHQCRFRTSQGRRRPGQRQGFCMDSQCGHVALFLSAITVMELEIGIQRAERKDPRQGIVLRAWMNGRVMRTFAAQVLPTDVKIARRCAALHVPDRRSERDALIPATALVHGMIVVTRNVADFTPLGTPLLNPGHPTEAATHPMRRLGGPPDLRASQVLARRLLRVAPSARSCAFSLRTSWLRSRISATASSPASKSRSSRRPRGRAADPGYETAILPGGRRRR